MFKFNSVPAYSIGKSRFNGHEEAVPGPGAYDTSKLLDIKQKHVGTTVVYKNIEAKKTDDKNGIGPGAYETSLKTHIRGYYNGKSKTSRGDANNSETPGPGQYATERMLNQTGKGCSVPFDRSKKDVGGNSTSVGPGHYSTDKYTMFEGKNKAWSFSKAKINNKGGTDVPGPAAYAYEQHYAVNSKRGFSISKAPKFDKIESATPGPGMYENKTTAINSKGCSFPKMQERTRVDSLPGPGYYDADVNKVKNRAHGNTFDKTSRPDKKENIPGPGQYNNNITAIANRGTKFTKSKRYQDTLENAPAPGQYNLISTDKSTGVIFDKQHVRSDTINKNPGPGQYNLGEKYNPKFAHVKAVLKNDAGDIPGPGQYDIKTDNWSNRVPAFDKTGRGGLTSKNNVGPGDYNIPHTIPDVARYNYPDVSKRKIHI